MPRKEEGRRQRAQEGSSHNVKNRKESQIQSKVRSRPGRKEGRKEERKEEGRRKNEGRKEMGDLFLKEAKVSVFRLLVAQGAVMSSTKN